MLQVNTIQTEFKRCMDGLQKRGISNAEQLLNEIIALDDERKKIQGTLDETLRESNLLAKEIGDLFKSGKRGEAEAIKSKTGELKEKSKVLSEEQSKVQVSLEKALYNIPNIPHESVVAGNSDADNEIIKVDDKSTPNLGAAKRPHWELIEAYDIVDFELGNKVTGSGFPFYKKQGARLVRGLINYFIDKGVEAGFEEVQPPILINEASGVGTGQLPDKEGQMYHAKEDDLYLIPTAEVPITNMYRDVILSYAELPKQHVGHTPCFRREAGSWGSHVRGLNRLHQFDKVEIVKIVSPEDSYQVLDEMAQHIENLIQSLGLPYRILRLCAGDLGFTSALTYDFEVYSAAQEKWLEVSSVSNFESFQSNRLKLRIKHAEGKKELAHTLNGSALALPRIMAAILENNQEADCIKMPEVLIPYLGFSEIKKG